MLCRLVLVFLLLTGLALLPQARASQACCEQGCEAMPACVSVCAVCASPAALLPVEPALRAVAVAASALGPTVLSVYFDDAVGEIWNPPD